MSDELENTVATEESTPVVATEEPKTEQPEQIEPNAEPEQEESAEDLGEFEVIRDEDEEFLGEEPELAEPIEGIVEPEPVEEPEDGEILDEDGEPLESESEAEAESESTETIEPKAEASVEPTPAAAPEEPPSQSMVDNVNERIKNEVKEDYIPNTKEFRDGVRAEAKQAVIDELGTDEFDPYDDEHQLLFLEKAQQISQRRTNAFNAAVNKFQNEYKQKEYAAKQQSFRDNLDNQVKAILNTPAKQQALEQALDGISHKEFKRIQNEIANGKGDGLIKLAKAVASKMGIAQQKAPARKPAPQPKPQQPARKDNHDEYVSDFFGW